jgi:hypothetical protein
MIYPMFAMVVLTFVVLIATATLRVRSVVQKDVSVDYYKLMSGYDAPDHVVKVGRQLSNLFEMPVLFYVAGLAYMLMGMESSGPITIAWLFVFARVAHAFVHVTYNNPLHRLVVFMAGNLCILLMWLWIVASAI